MNSIKCHLARLSSEIGAEVTEKTLYLSHMSYYHRLADMNLVLADRISNRREPVAYIPRLYTRTTVSQLREEHFEAFVTVSKLLDLKYELLPFRNENECAITSGGERAPGRDVIRAIFSHFIKKVRDFNESSFFIAFIMNYCFGCRVSELISLTTSNIDFILKVIKFRTKDTLKRTNTTKVIPLFTFALEQLLKYLQVRNELLQAKGDISETRLFLLSKDGVMRHMTASDLNNYYREISITNDLIYFTSHSVRYQTQTDMTEKGLSFIYTNCILSHYPIWDAIFNRYSDLSFTDFCEKYISVLEIILKEVL